jgi:hypothetical protein
MADAGLQFAAVDFATLAREIAQDIFEVGDIIALHRLSDEEWQRIQAHPRFIAMLGEMQRSWSSAENTRERIRIKAQTGLETQLETLIRDVGDPDIPLAQRVEAGKFLARLGELDGQGRLAGGDGGAFHITLNIGALPQVSIEATAKPVIDVTPGAIPDG